MNWLTHGDFSRQIVIGHKEEEDANTMHFPVDVHRLISVCFRVKIVGDFKQNSQNSIGRSWLEEDGDWL